MSSNQQMYKDRASIVMWEGNIMSWMKVRGKHVEEGVRE